jgi:hypothetical protein
MTSISAAQKKNLNKMNRASKDVLLGTIVSDLITSASSSTGTLAASIATLQGNSTVSASHTVTAGEATASKVILVTGLAKVTGFIGQDLRSGSPIINAKWTSGSVAGTIIVESGVSGSPLPLASGDVVTYIAF